MRKLQFYGLPRSLQDRFIESSLGAAAPVPLLVRRFRSQAHARWFAGGALALVGWGVFVAYGFGELSHPLALAGPQMLAVHAAFAAVAIACFLRGQALRWEALRVPYPEGTYLFPAVVIDARRGHLVERDVGSLRAVTVRGGRLQVEFDDKASFTFDAGSAELAEKAKAAVEATREQWGRLQTEDARLERARLNPLVESGVPNPLASTIPLSGQRFLKPATYVLITVISAAMLGWAVWWWRNTLSEKALYASATARNDVEAYHEYLTRGGRRADVVEVLLPRARLNAARAAGSVDAIRQYIAANPETRIAAEVQDALRTALLDALEGAKAQGTITALAEYEKKHPEHSLVVAELAAARSAVYRNVVAAFAKEAAPETSQIVPFVERLVKYVEKHGPRVDVRVAHQFPQRTETLDDILSKSRKYYMGQRSLPTQYFLGEHAARRQTALAERLIERLQRSFPKDVLEFRFLGPAEDVNETLPEIEVPTLTLTHAERLSGGFVGGKPKTMFLGASISVSASFEIPGQGEPFVFKWGKWTPPNVRKADESEKSVPAVIPDVYEDMVGGAFETFGTQFLKAWYAEP